MKKFLLIQICFVILISGCNFDWLANEDGIRIHNISSKTIRVCGAYILPDTKLPQEQLKTVKIPAGKTDWVMEYILNDKNMKRFKTEKITLFILDEQVFKTTSWDTIRKYDMILKRYEINREDYMNSLIKYKGATAFPIYAK